ncbi:hypothetical protein [Actinacidiphila acididurans]|uniref:Uncharacterized protein n=1 Tax=Actinacidiphila acididurans TaxID=2784346 RepID=A0ABS2TY33_9ACTN|nr:hypothetical protein [Actinacidiphila acididurans]MBM9507712.1 hypothetical protein [Actinacidiphila acididurans]
MALHPAFWPLHTPLDSALDDSLDGSLDVPAGTSPDASAGTSPDSPLDPAPGSGTDDGRPYGTYVRTFGLWRGRADWVNPRSGNPASTGPAVPAWDDDCAVAASWIADGIGIAGLNLVAVFSEELEVAAGTAGAAAFLDLADLLTALPGLATEAAGRGPGDRTDRTARTLGRLAARLQVVWEPWTDLAAELLREAGPAARPAPAALIVQRLRDLAARDLLAFVTCLAHLIPTGLPGQEQAVESALRRMIGDDWPAGRSRAVPARTPAGPWPDLHHDLAAALAPLDHRRWRESHDEVREFADLLADFLAGRTPAPAADTSLA